MFIDMRIDHALLGVACFERVEFLANLFAGLFRRSTVVGLRRFALLWLGQDVAQATDFGDELLLGLPFGFEAGEFLLQLGDLDVDLGNPLARRSAEISIAGERLALRLARRDGTAGVLDLRRNCRLADRDARRGRVKQADRLVG